MSKRILSLVLALVMVLGTFGTVFAAAPSDVVGTEYETAVDRLIQLGALDGYPDGTFKPLNTITRAEFAAAVVKTKGLKAAAEAAKGLPTDFTDVPATSWASGYIGVASNQGLVNGVGWGQFDPESPVKYEEAITMVMRALGYEEAAQARGGYPYGYLIVANETGLLDSVKGTQGLPAPRGLVAQLLDNALEIPMMIQVGYGSQTTWVVSGTMNTEPRLILDELGFANVVGRVTSVNETRSRITVGGETLTVGEDFDFNFVEGLRIKAYYSGTKLVIFTALEEAMYAPTTGGTKITVDSTKYAVNKDAKLELNNEKDVKAADFTADYAKVLLNEDDEIVWAKGYTLPYALVVAEVDGNLAYDFAKDDLNLKDYTILKDGKTVSIEDLEELDVLLYNNTEKFAIVYNDSKVGEIDRVYADDFRFDGDVLTIAGKYLDGKAFGNLDKDILAAMMAEEEEVEVFFNTQGDVALVVGNRGVAPSSSFYGYVTYANVYSGRGGKMLALDVRNSEGKVVSFDIAEDSKVANKYAGLTGISGLGKVTALEDTVILVTVDKDEKLTKLATVASHPATSSFKLTATYVSGYRLQDSTIIFHDGGKKAVELGEAKGFTEILANSTIYVNATDRIVAVVGTTNVDTDSEKVTDLVTSVRQLRSGQTEFTFINGDRYVTTAVDKYASYKDFGNEIVELTIGKTSGEVTAAVNLSKPAVIVEKRSTGSRTIEDSNTNIYELISGAKLYDVTGKAKAISLIDLNKGDKIEVHFDGTTTRFVKFVVRVGDDKVVNEPATGAVSYINGGVFKAGLPNKVDTFVFKLYNNAGTLVATVAADEYGRVDFGASVVAGSVFKVELVNLDTGAVVDTKNILAKTAVAVNLTAATQASNVTVDFGTTEANAKAKLAKTTELTDANGDKYTAAITWTIAGYNKDAAAAYTAAGTFVTPAGLTTNGIVINNVTVTVDPSKVTIIKAIDEDIVTAVNNSAKTVTVAFGTDNTDLALGGTTVIDSTDGSAQSYGIFESDGTTARTGALVTGDKLVVTAEDGTTKATYVVTVMAARTGNDLTILNPVYGVITGLDIENVKTGATKAEFLAAISVSDGATVVISGTDPIIVGTTVTVTSESAVSKVYTVK